MTPPRPAKSVAGHNTCPLCGGSRDAGPVCANYHLLVDLVATVTLDGQIYE